MSHFRIELRTADRVWEAQDLEMVDLTALRTEVARFVGDLLRDHAKEIWADREWRVDVTDEAGLILYVMHISATDSAATIPLRR